VIPLIENMPYSQRIEPQPGQESAWDYPRPPRLEPTPKHLTITFNGETIADTKKAWRVLETSHPPVYYLPPEDIRMEFLRLTQRRSFCEFKGSANYWTVKVGSQEEKDCAWSYENPSPAFQPIKGYIAFYASKMDTCTVEGEEVDAQEGDFYGGWITADIVGPFKGSVGTWGW
jgi:uncharacterized protein (DUF427 family)